MKTYSSGRKRVHGDGASARIVEAIVEYVTKADQNQDDPFSVMLLETAQDLCEELALRLRKHQGQPT